MARNGSGTYDLPAGNPVITGTVISSTDHNNTMSDIATALTNSIAKDGQTVPSANLPMGGYKHTNVASGASLTDYARVDQTQNSTMQWLTSVSGADTITATASPAPSAYAAGQTFRFVAAGANTGAATLNINSLGAKSITKNGTTALSAGDIPSGAVATVVYDGTQFQLANVSITNALTGYAQLTADQTWTGAQRGTATTDNDGSFDQSVTNNFICTPTGNVTLTFTNHTSGQSGFVLFDNSGGYTGHSVAGTTKVDSSFLSTINATGTYLISYFDNGTNAYCVTSKVLA